MTFKIRTLSPNKEKVEFEVDVTEWNTGYSGKQEVISRLKKEGFLILKIIDESAIEDNFELEKETSVFELLKDQFIRVFKPEPDFETIPWEVQISHWVAENSDELLRTTYGWTIDDHAQELSILRNQLTVKSRYGLIDDDKWKDEVKQFIFNVLKAESEDEEVMEFLHDKIDEITINYQSEIVPLSDEMTGIEYEQFVANSLCNYGWDAYVTKASNDQGVDVLAEKQGVKIAVQCKFYSSNVGNAAVQEIIAGSIFEQADIAVVVSNAAFTSSAKQLASSANVILIHHDLLDKIDELCLE